MTTSEVLIVLCTCPDDQTAGRIAAELVESRLAACVTALPGITSYYRWQGKLSTDTEVQLLIKTTESAYAGLEPALRKMHPYELPEILAVGVNNGLAPYLDWIAENTTR